MTTIARPAPYLLPALMAMVGLGCGGPNEVTVAEAAQPIVNGVETEGDDAVIGLLRDQKIVCTATMISRRVAVTAAHCLGDAPPSHAYFGSHPTEEGGVRIPLVAARPHPAFDLATFASDIGVVVLAADAPAPPVEMLPIGRGAALSVARPVRLVGFGDARTPAPVAKRSGDAAIGQVSPGSLVLRPDPAQPCAGDSGGPAFVRLDREYLAGVVSHGDAACRAGGTVTRVDAHRDGFIAAELEAAQRAAAAGEGCRVSGSRRDGSGTGLCAMAALLLLARRSRRGATGPRASNQP